MLSYPPPDLREMELGGNIYEIQIVPLGYSLWLWRAFKDRLLAKTNLYNKDILVNMIFNFCKEGNEILVHLLFHCKLLICVIPSTFSLLIAYKLLCGQMGKGLHLS